MTIAKGHREVPYKLRVMDSHPPRSYHRSALKSSQTFHLTLDHTATKTQPLMIAVPPRSREVAGLELCNVTVRLVTAEERDAAERLQQQEAEEQRRTSSRPLKRSRSSSDRGGVVEPKQQGEKPTSTPPPRQQQQENETVVVVVWLALLDATGRRLPEVPDFPLASFTFSPRPSASALSTNNVRTSKISLPMCPGQRVTVYLSTTTSDAGAGQSSPLVLCTLTGTGYLNHPSEEDDDDEGDEHDDDDEDRRTTRRRRRGGGGDHSDVFGKMLKGGDVAGPKALERLLSTLPPSPSSPTAEGSGEREDGKLLSSEPPLDGVSRQASDPQQQQQQQRSSGSRRRDELLEKKKEKTSSFPSEDEEVPTLTYAFVAGSDSQS